MKRYATHIDIMFGDRFHCTLRNYIVDTLFGAKKALSDMIAYIYTKKPYLQRRGDFDIYFKNWEGKNMHFNIQTYHNQQ